MPESTEDERKRAEALVLAKWPGSGSSSIEAHACAIGLAANRAETGGLRRGIAEAVMLLHSDDDPENRCMAAFDALGELLTGDPAVDATVRERDELREKCERLQGWVADLQAGCYINCVYCGHRYGPDDEVPATMAEVLKEHIAACPKHPLFAAEADARGLAEAATSLLAELTVAKMEQSEGSVRAAAELEGALSAHDARGS